MARVTVEDCLDHCPDQFALVHLAALRYRQLHRGARRLVESRNKEIVTALREIATGKVTFREDVAELVMRIQRQALGGPREEPSAPSALMEDDLGTSLI
jgi:DNA-directed RNA polymerase subunit omega